MEYFAIVPSVSRVITAEKTKAQIPTGKKEKFYIFPGGGGGGGGGECESGKNKMRKRWIGSFRPSQFIYLSLMKLRLETEYKIKGKILDFDFFFLPVLSFDFMSS